MSRTARTIAALVTVVATLVPTALVLGGAEGVPMADTHWCC